LTTGVRSPVISTTAAKMRAIVSLVSLLIRERRKTDGCSAERTGDTNLRELRECEQ
jgi:hypothetical protein